MANGHYFAQGHALGSISRRKPKQLTPQRTLQIAVHNLTPDPANAWALHPRPLASFLSLGGCTSDLNVPVLRGELWIPTGGTRGPLRFVSGRHLREALWNFENKNILFMLPFF